jgi:hypothetical protein
MEHSCIHDVSRIYNDTLRARTGYSIADIRQQMADALGLPSEGDAVETVS